MDIDQFRDYCLAKKGTTESFPFDETTLVFKVMGKMYALSGLNTFVSVNLKCDPELAIDLRERYHAVQPGFHMNKTHWNTILYNEDAADQKIFEWIDHSYELVAKSLTKKLKEELANL